MENTHNKNVNTSNQQATMNIAPIKMPKNIRQIGKIGANKIIYAEDYVMTYMKQLSEKEYAGCKVAVLLGYYIRTEESKNIFIKGAVEMKCSDFSSEITFSDEGWTSVYENIKKYFTDVEIVGWALIGPEFFIESEEKVRKIHMENFSGADKTLLKIDSLEKEEAFYLYENNQLVKQPGYYIYYEKNEEMQNYMVEDKASLSQERNFNDQITKKIRNVVQEKKEPQNEKSVIRLLYAASTLLAIIVLVIAATMLTNYGKLRNMETALNALSDNLGGKEQDDSATQVADKNQSNNEDQATVETQDDNAVADNEVDLGTTDNETTSSNNSQTADDNQDTMEVETVSGNVTKQEDTSDEKASEPTETEKTADAEESAETGKVEETSEEETAQANKEETVKSETDSTKAESEKSDDTQTVKDTSEDKTDDKAIEASAEVKYYTVKTGESLASISFALYQSYKYVSVIQELNGIEDIDKIYVGQKLIVP